jgi:hypothetical protein
MPRIPQASHFVIDQTLLNGLGPFAYLHRLEVEMPVDWQDHESFNRLTQWIEGCTWVEFENIDGISSVSVCAHDYGETLSKDLAATMQGELVEIWVRLTQQ